MTTWWELAIPAITGFTGVWSGAWWQGRTSEKLTIIQNQQALASQQMQFQHEKSLRFIEERRNAYATLMTRLNEYIKLEHKRIDARTHAEALKPDEEGGSSEELHSYAAATEEVAALTQESMKLVNLITGAIYVVMLSAPEEIFQKAAQLTMAATKAQSTEEIGQLLNEFISLARRDLGVSESSGTFAQSAGNQLPT